MIVKHQINIFCKYFFQKQKKNTKYKTKKNTKRFYFFYCFYIKKKCKYKLLFQHHVLYKISKFLLKHVLRGSYCNFIILLRTYILPKIFLFLLFKSVVYKSFFGFLSLTIVLNFLYKRHWSKVKGEQSYPKLFFSKYIV